MSKFALVVFFACVVGVVSGQADTAIRLVVSSQRLSDSAAELSVLAKIPKGVRLYTLRSGFDTTLCSAVNFEFTATVRADGGIAEAGNIVASTDSSVGGPVRFVTDSLRWSQRFVIRDSGQVTIKTRVTYFYLQKGTYLSGDTTFKTFIVPVAAGPSVGVSAGPSVGAAAGGSALAGRSLWWIFLAAFGGGLLALLTPCVYSMIPITVSFFTKRSRTKAEGRRNAIAYALSIVIIFTVIGFGVTLIFGPAALNNLATNWIANLVFFALFIAFGLSFLGAFEIGLPGSWSSHADAKAGTGSFSGIFFMALTLVIVSFSCTGPIIGNLLVLAARGSYYGPLVGMFGFSLALALPFALFAFFPSKLNVLGKAGGWLNAVKVTLGFLELALALKFLSNADLARGWRLLDREIFLCLWIVIFGLLGVYLLGRLKLRHDDELPKNDFGQPHLSVVRLLCAIFSVAFCVYLVPGLWGAPLKGVSAFLPPMGTQDFNAAGGYPGAGSPGAGSLGAGGSGAPDGSARAGVLKPAKYVSQMKIYEPEVVTRFGLRTYFDYNEALAAARALHKPLMLDFTGINCVNCRKMEGQVWSDPAVMQILKNDFVIASLYVDVQNIDLPVAEQYFSKDLGRRVETLGDRNADLQVSRFGANTQPYYFFVDGNEHKLADEGYGYDPDIARFVAHLRKVIDSSNLRTLGGLWK